jgi:hypothetical protein
MFKPDWKTTLIICTFLAICFYWLIGMARGGEPVGWVIILAVLAILMLLMLVGGLVAIVRTMKASDHTGFTHYAREQMVLMKQMQALQNTQTSIVARRNVQLEQMARRQLPPPENQEPAIIFGDDIFEDLDDLDFRNQK